MSLTKNQIAVKILKKTLELKTTDVALANHVKDCLSCLTIMRAASIECRDHFRGSKG